MISTSSMRELEDSCGISKLELMENAGRGAFSEIVKWFDKCQVLVVCHHGNNGGDGFVIARYLIGSGWDVDVLFIGEDAKFKSEAAVNFKKLDKVVRDYKAVDFNSYGLIIDCMLGTGVLGALRSPIKEIVSLCNGTDAKKVSIDVPTGINPDSGERKEVFFESDLVITFHDIKNGLVDLKEKVVVVDIGIK